MWFGVYVKEKVEICTIKQLWSGVHVKENVEISTLNQQEVNVLSPIMDKCQTQNDLESQQVPSSKWP